MVTPVAYYIKRVKEFFKKGRELFRKKKKKKRKREKNKKRSPCKLLYYKGVGILLKNENF